MTKVIIPKVEIPTKGLSDIFVDLMTDAMKTSPDEARLILKIPE